MAAIIDQRFLDGEFLVPEEAMAKYKQTKIEPMHDRYRLDDHNMLKDFERRKGRVLHSSELIHRLKKLNPALVVQHQVNFADDWGLYLDVRGKLVALSGFPKGWLTEFSYSLIDERDLPTEERRGWRTVIVRLLGRGAITWQQVVDEFGNSTDFNASRWLAATAPFRNSNGSGKVSTNLDNEFATFFHGKAQP